MDYLNQSGLLPYELVWKPTLITNELIRRTFNEANTDGECAGVITWMHTFSPAKSWILGLMEGSHIRVVRVADNMRNVAVTEGTR